MRLRNWRIHFLITTVLASAALRPLGAQDPVAWPAIPAEDLALKDNPAKPGSSAMILIKKQTRDDVKHTLETFYRIKIFNDNGRRYGDIEIPYVPKTVEVSEMSARVVQADGRTFEFKGPIYEKTIVRRRTTRVMAKTFTLPDVKPGVIIDYRYLLKSKSDAPPDGAWIIQEKLFIRRADIEWRPMAGPVEWRVFSRSLPAAGNLMSGEKGILRATMTNLPAFEEEPFMPPDATVKMR